MLKYISFYGKAPRLEYWCLAVASIMLPLLSIGAFLLVLFVFFRLNLQDYKNLADAVIILFLILVTLVYFFAAIRRCRDASVSPLYALLVFVPYTFWVSAIAIGCIRTNEGKRSDLPSDSEKENMAKSPTEIWKNLSKKLTKKRKEDFLYQGKIMLFCHMKVVFVLASIAFWLWTTSIAIQFFRTFFLVAFYGVNHLK